MSDLMGGKKKYTVVGIWGGDSPAFGESFRTVVWADGPSDAIEQVDLEFGVDLMLAGAIEGDHVLWEGDDSPVEDEVDE